jgi:hypothetical protein
MNGKFNYQSENIIIYPELGSAVTKVGPFSDKLP